MIRTRTLLLLGAAAAASAASASPVQAARYIFGGEGTLEEGRRYEVTAAATQFILDNGALVSLVDAAGFLVEGNEVRIDRGGITIAASDRASVRIVTPSGTALVAGAASLTVSPQQLTGNVLGGSMTVEANGERERYARGETWRAMRGEGPRRVMANAAQRTPSARVASLQEGGISAAAENGLPVALGEALEALGAQGDVVSAARALDRASADATVGQLPSGDVETLLDFSDSLASALGGTAFSGATPQLIDAYLQFLAAGGQIGNFQSAYTALINQYLAALAGGGAAADLPGIGYSALSAYLAYLEETGTLSRIAAEQQGLLAAYLDFISTGGTPQDFVTPGALLDEEVLSAYVAAIENYVALLSAGGDPDSFSVAPETILAYLESLEASGLIDQLLDAQASALQDYLDFVRGGGEPEQFDGFVDLSGSLSDAVAQQYASAVEAYVQFLRDGGLPSEFGTSASLIATYLQALRNADLLNPLLGQYADQLTAYLDFVSGGGDPADFGGFGISDALAQQYAATVQNYIAFLQGGGDPADFGTGVDTITAYLEALEDNGLLAQLLGAQAQAVQDYLAFIEAGGDPADFGGFGLSQALIDQYVQAVEAYIAFVQGGGDPADFAGGADVVTAYLQALSQAGILDTIFGTQSAVLQAYLDFLAQGGNPGEFGGFGLDDGLVQQYVGTLNAFLAFIADGGVPSEFAGLTAEVFQAYLEALKTAGLLGQLLPQQADFLNDYLAFLQGGGAFDEFGQLPQPFEFPVPQGTLASNNFIAFRGTQQEFGAPFNGQIDRSRSDVIYDESTGAPLYFKLNSLQISIGEADLVDTGQASAGGVSWGRWVSGTAYASPERPFELQSSGLHVIAGPPVFDMPTEGLIEYDLSGGTTPTLGTNSTGELTKALAAISFGSETKVGLEIQTTFADRVYDLQTVGGIMATAENGIALREDLAPGFFFGQTTQTDGGLIIATRNGIDLVGEMRGYISGGEAAELAVSYFARENDGLEMIGTAAFTKGDPLQTGGTGGPGGSRDVTPSGTVSDYRVAYIGRNTNNAGAAPEVTFAEDGSIAAYTYRPSGGNVLSFARGDAEEAEEFGFIGDIVQWTRWGSALQNTFRDGAFHIVTGISPLALPTEGTVSYGLVGGTAPTGTRFLASEEAGAFTGSLSVAFAAAPTVTLDSQVFLGDRAYAFSGTNNIFENDFNFLGLQGSVSGLNDASCTSSCSGQFVGSFFGEDGSFAGLYYSIGDGIGSSAGGLVGTAVFEAGVEGIEMVGTLPGSGGGETATLADFDPSAVRVTGAYTAERGFAFTFGDGGAAVLEDGTFAPVSMESFGRTLFANEGAAADSIAGNDDVLIARYLGEGFEVEGTERTSLGPAFVSLIDSRMVTDLPTAGTITYSIFAATPFTPLTGGGEEGSISGDLLVAFGASPTIAADIDVLLDRTYNFQTSDAQGGTAIPLGGVGFDFLAYTEDSGTICAPGDCTLFFQGAFSEDFGDIAGLATFDAPEASYAAAVAFSADDLGGLVLGGTGGGAEVPPLSGDIDNAISVYVTGTNNSLRGGDTVTFDEAGVPTAVAGGQFGIGTANRNESGTVAGLIGWSRWAGGEVTEPFGRTTTIRENEGVHVIAGTPATDLPASGTVQYQLAGATAPTRRGENPAAPGTFSGDLAVAFGGQALVGMNLAVGYDGENFALSTPGGAADPANGGLAVDGEMKFSGGLAVTSDGASCTTQCGATLNGFLSGAGASAVGIGYTIDSSDGSIPGITGAAAFTAPGS
ncbi:hypothetical protein B5C34_01995 [Pacificimonas flava]|uniref:Uncharacterized protein n=2 Tax=Pacificimonas TaxID=1960290 RepID=A0A219B201_9SPHN|nr:MULTISPECIES: hypothetical protein [Pacificimonas]MBZ6378010.1 hypothetical protein [Pacificimonas aurantium]OWV32345.1 hypothetical protein B5C34_01995 [Pacificimonas flava]